MMTRDPAGGRPRARRHRCAGAAASCVLLLLPVRLAAQPAPDSAALEARLTSAEALYGSFSRIAAAPATPAWLDDSDRFVFRTGAGPAAVWTMVDPARNDARSWEADSAEAAVAAAAGGVRRRWSDGPSGYGIAIRDSAGQVVLSAEGEPQYQWGAGPMSWSPDGERMMALRIDARRVHGIPIVDYGTAIERVEMVPYAKAGTPLPTTELYLLDPAAGSISPVRLGDDEAYVWHIGWRKDGSEALVLRLSRDGKRLDLVGIDATTASHRVIVREERPETFVAGLDLPAGGVQRLVSRCRMASTSSGFRSGTAGGTSTSTASTVRSSGR